MTRGIPAYSMRVCWNVSSRKEKKGGDSVVRKRRWLLAEEIIEQSPFDLVRGYKTSIELRKGAASEKIREVILGPCKHLLEVGAACVCDLGLQDAHCVARLRLG